MRKDPFFEEFLSQSFSETEKIGSLLMGKLSSPVVLALQGDLGAGKTTFVKGLARSLEIKDLITSPAFTIVSEYEGLKKIPLFHFDFYRLEHFSEIDDLGVREYFDKPGVVVIEWPERAPFLLPDKYYRVSFQVLGPDSRKITVEEVRRN